MNATQSLLAALRAFEEGTDRLRLLPELLKLAEEAEAIEELAEAVEAASEDAKDDAEAAELIRFVARLREQLKQPAPATVLWNDLLGLLPTDPEALEHLFKLFKQAGEAKSAAEVGLRRARLAEGTERIERLLEAAALYEDAGATSEALDALEESLSAGNDIRALKAIERLLAHGTPASLDSARDERGARRAALHARALEGLARLEPANDQGKVHLRRAQLLIATDPTTAAAAFGLAIQSGGATAEAIAGLQQLLTTPARMAAARALEHVYRERKEPRSLAEMIEIQLEGMDGQRTSAGMLTIDSSGSGNGTYSLDQPLVAYRMVHVVPVTTGSSNSTVASTDLLMAHISSNLGDAGGTEANSSSR